MKHVTIHFNAGIKKYKVTSPTNVTGAIGATIEFKVTGPHIGQHAVVGFPNGPIIRDFDDDTIITQLAIPVGESKKAKIKEKENVWKPAEPREFEYKVKVGKFKGEAKSDPVIIIHPPLV